MVGGGPVVAGAHDSLAGAAVAPARRRLASRRPLRVGDVAAVGAAEPLAPTLVGVALGVVSAPGPLGGAVVARAAVGAAVLLSLVVVFVVGVVALALVAGVALSGGVGVWPP